jgi:DNA polymerase I-like protein with 3'-5' exonuclease and polymerase domains
MIEAYESGDPYLYFAKKAGAVPEDGTKAEYQAERDLFKATTLGLQYGMGAENLAIKLTADCGRLVTLREAEKLITLHKKTYPTYWRWLETDISRVYKRNGYLMLFDGWSLLPNQDNDLSVKNFPVQGTGAVIMRIAIDLFIARGGHPLAPLHDAIYAIFCNATESHHPKLLGECMQEAVEIVLGQVEIRQDVDIHGHDQIWIEPKGKKYYEMLKVYLEPMQTEQDRVERLHKVVYGF